MHICGMDFSSLVSYWQIKALLMPEPSVVTPQNQYFPANSERMSVHWLTDIQLPDTQLSDTQVPDIQVPGHSGPRTSRSPDIQVFWTSRSFGHPGLSDFQFLFLIVKMLVMSVEYICWYWIYHANTWGMNVSWRVSVCPSGTGLGNVYFWKCIFVLDICCQ